MARKKLTISQKTYKTTDSLGSKNKSSTNIIAERSQKKGNLLEYVRSFAPDNELADRLEKVLEEREHIYLRAARIR